MLDERKDDRLPEISSTRHLQPPTPLEKVHTDFLPAIEKEPSSKSFANSESSSHSKILNLFKGESNRKQEEPVQKVDAFEEGFVDHCDPFSSEEEKEDSIGEQN